MIFKIVILVISFNLISCSKPTLYVGTYTTGESDGIYRFEFDTKTGKLTNKTLVATTENPSFLRYAKKNNTLYAVNENEQGEISAFRVNKDSLVLLNKVSSNGGHPCHIALNEAEDTIIVSNYTGGTCSIYTIKNNGEINTLSQVISHNTNHITSHVHSAQFTDTDLYVADLGKNSVFLYRFNNGVYNEVTSSIVPFQPNSGPRHFATTSDGAFIYIINELSSTISIAKKFNDTFILVDTISTLEDGFNEKSYCADIHLSADERFVYGSNRGENSIAVFKRHPIDGTLKKIQSISVHGDWPRNFTLDPSGNFILVANQKSNNIAVFSINKTSGKLTFLHDIEIASPVCLLF